MAVFVLDENVFLWALAGGGQLETVGGRYRKVGNDYQEAGELVRAIAANGHELAYSEDWTRRFFQKANDLKVSGVQIDGEIFRLLVQMRNNPGRSKSEHRPTVVDLPGFPPKDLYLAYLAIATEAIIVTEDEGVLAAAAGGALGFDAVSIADALRRARALE